MPVIRYAARQLLKSPGFTLVAILGLALGIGATVALFSLVHSVFLRPLPYHEPDRLVRLASTNQENDLIRVGFSYSRFLEVQERQQVFGDLALSAANAFTLTGRGGDPEQVIGLHASAALLPTLGLRPIVGRNFSPDEDRPGGPRVVLISEQMWQQRFNRDAAVPGQAGIGHINCQPHEYWHDKFNARGYAMLDCIRPYIRHPDVSSWYRKNVFAYVAR